MRPPRFETEEEFGEWANRNGWTWDGEYWTPPPGRARGVVVLIGAIIVVVLIGLLSGCEIIWWPQVLCYPESLSDCVGTDE